MTPLLKVLKENNCFITRRIKRYTLAPLQYHRKGKAIGFIFLCFHLSGYPGRKYNCFSGTPGNRIFPAVPFKYDFPAEVPCIPKTKDYFSFIKKEFRIVKCKPGEIGVVKKALNLKLPGIQLNIVYALIVLLRERRSWRLLGEDTVP